MFPAVVTLRGIEGYFEEHNGKTLFDDIRLPEGISKDLLVPFIITRAGDFPVMIIDPDYMYNMTNTFFDAWYDNFDRMNKAFSADYDPLENYNRTETEEHADSGSKKNTSSSSAEQQSSNLAVGSSSGTVEEKIAADDSNTYVNRDQTTNSENDRSSSSGSVKDSGETSSNEQRAEAGQRKLHAFGNIGTMTSQMMLESEIKLRADFNIMEFIADKYIEEFCVPIYC